MPPPEVECVYLAPHHGSFFLNFDYALPPPRRKKLNPHECQILEPPPCFLLNSQADFYQFVSATQSTPFRKVPWHPNLHMLKFWPFHIFKLVIYLAAWLFKLHLYLFNTFCQYLLTLIYFDIPTSPENTFNIIKPLINGNTDLNGALLQKKEYLDQRK